MKVPQLTFVERSFPKPRAPRPVIAFILILAALIFILSIIWAGYHAKPPKFDWAAAAEAGTAVGTMMLALATVWLALEGRAERNHARRLADIQERDEERKDRAWLFVQSAEVYFPNGAANPRDAIAEVCIANAGHGPAINVYAALSVWGERKRGSGLSNIGVKAIPLIMPMSTKTITIHAIQESQPLFSKDVTKLTCIDVQYGDRLSMTDGQFRHADPFWDLVSKPRPEPSFAE